MNTPKHLIEQTLLALSKEVTGSNYLSEVTVDKVVQFLSIPAVYDHYKESRDVDY